MKVSCTVWSGGKVGNVRHCRLTYHYSSTDVPIILTDDFARKCALGIAKGVVAVAGGQIVENPPQVQNTPTEAKYYVQVGAYSQKETAEKQLKIARSVGFSDAFIKKL